MKAFYITLAIAFVIGISAWLLGADLVTLANLAVIGAFVIALLELIRRSFPSNH